MRKDEKGNFKTLEQDIVEIWKQHGLEVIEEKFSNNTWTIKAKKFGDKGCSKPFQKVFKTNSKYPEDYLICGYTKIGDEIQFCLKCQENKK